MLELQNITKDYDAAGETVHALKGISLKFRKSEFVSVLGASGCGKTTLLNIIGGLDKYTSGDLIIEGVSTKEYKDRDWDTYRNHSIGFIFQSYHLIPHQTILQNVELALTISGVSKKERKKRAIEALQKVGLGDKIKARPNQLSGGQAQRVAIARALINDPEIVLADEPTGALDSKTSVQIMELLKEISKDRLVIMVTHNPELAEKYSTRIINLFDGEVVGDSMPYDGADEAPAEAPKKKRKGRKKNASMSMRMAFSLSMKNLISKRRRTTLVSFAGSIGIIGVSLVLAISAGVQNYIDDMENDMLSGYPVSIEQTALDYSSLLDMSASNTNVDITKLDDKVYVDSMLEQLASLGSSLQTVNNISEEYVDYVSAMPEEYYNLLTYGYGFNMANNIYTDFYVTNEEQETGEFNDAYASSTMSITAIRSMYSSILANVPDYASFSSMVGTVDSYSEIPDNYEYIMSQYEVVAIEDGNGGVSTTTYTDAQLKEIFEDKSSLIMVVDDSEVTDMTLAQFGYFTEEQFLNYAYYYIGTDGEPNEYYNEEYGLLGSYTDGGLDYSYFIGDNAKKFTWYSNDSIYSKETVNTYYSGYLANSEETYVYKSNVQGGDYSYTNSKTNLTQEVSLSSISRDSDTVDLSVRLILQKKDGISYGCLDSGIYYTEALTEHMLSTAENSEIVQYINETGDLESLNYFFNYTYTDTDEYIKDANGDDTNELNPTYKQYVTYTSMSSMSDTGDVTSTLISNMLGVTVNSTVTASMLGGDRLPTSIYIYPVDFNTKDDITAYLDVWNDWCASGETYTTSDGTTVTLSTSDKITYTDTIGLIIDLINTMIQMITIALICFTALSLVVSTVMIGIITYVSVVERIKEIGILRSVGARKKDIKRLFNSETFIIGLAAGLIGILVTYILSFIINLAVGMVAGIYTIAALPWWQAVVMVCVSVALTLISGLIPASSAAKKDPVVALRTE